MLLYLLNCLITLIAQKQDLQTLLRAATKLQNPLQVFKVKKDKAHSKEANATLILSEISGLYSKPNLHPCWDSSVMPTIYCVSLLLFRFANIKIIIRSIHLSTLNTQWMSGMIGYLPWVTYLSFGLCTVGPLFCLTSCYPFVLSMRDTPLLIENEWKALPRWLHLVWLHISLSLLF